MSQLEQTIQLEAKENLVMRIDRLVRQLITGQFQLSQMEMELACLEGDMAGIEEMLSRIIDDFMVWKLQEHNSRQIPVVNIPVKQTAVLGKHPRKPERYRGWSARH